MVAVTDVSEEFLVELADNIRTEKHAESLARKLGFKEAEIEKYMAENRFGGRVTCKGTLNMLYDWRDKTVPGAQQTVLKKALIDSGMARLAVDLPDIAPVHEG